jgi:hypothetical protein
MWDLNIIQLVQVQPGVPGPHVPGACDSNGRLLHPDGQGAVGEQIHRRANSAAGRIHKIQKEGE